MGLHISRSSDTLLYTIAVEALQQGAGARDLRGVMEHLLHRTMHEIPLQENINHYVVDEGVVLGAWSAKLNSHLSISAKRNLLSVIIRKT